MITQQPLTQHQSLYYAWLLTRRAAGDSVESLASTLVDSQVDLNPHQVDAALFACANPLSRGVILADEVGLGKTIEAGLVISQRWAERRRRILVIVPANLRKQWHQELQDKFSSQGMLLEARSYNAIRKQAGGNPFQTTSGPVICSYQFAKSKAAEIKAIDWDLVVLDEAHRLRNVYKTGNVIARTLKDALAHVHSKVLLTATPLQNSLLELYGLVSMIDDRVFGDIDSFRSQFTAQSREQAFAALRTRLAPVCKRTLRRQVQQYVPYTARRAIVEEFTPSAEERALSGLVADYLRRPNLKALPEGQRQLISLVLWKLLASSTHAIAGALETMARRLQGELDESADIPDLADELDEDYESLDEIKEERADEWSGADATTSSSAVSERDALAHEIAELQHFKTLATNIRENAKGSALLTALDKAFAELERLGAAKKASAFTHYDDGLEHSIWLGLMRDRLEIIRRLLTDDGSLWITIDDNEAHYLKVLCDEIFGRVNFVANAVWEKRTSRENRRVFSFNHDHLLIYSRNKPGFEQARNPLGLNQEVLNRYKNPDNDPRGPWQSVSVNAQAGHATASQFYTLELPSGRKIDPPKGRCWLFTKERMVQEIAAGNIWFGVDGNNAPRAKKFLRDYEDKGLTPETIWPAADVGTNDDAKKGLLQLLPDVPVFDNPKPESLLARVIHIATNPGDLILDSFAGSGTTGAVAHKMGRRWIMVELGEHCHTHVIPRLKKVIDGEDKGGVTEAAGWKGGGGFRYYKLAPSLIVDDRWGNPVINPEYNAAQLAEALAKLEGFSYAPSELQWWRHGHSSEGDFIHVTTQNLSAEQLQALSDEVGVDQSLLVCCAAFHGATAARAAERWPNLTLKKIPKMVLARCEWGHDDYSLNVANLPMAQPEPETTVAATRPNRKDGRTPDLFGDVAGEDAP